MQAAAATGDISALLNLIVSTSQMTPADFIKNTVGNIRFAYYSYIDKFHVIPIDLVDVVDGLLFSDAKQYILEQYMLKQRQASDNDRQ